MNPGAKGGAAVVAAGIRVTGHSALPRGVHDIILEVYTEVGVTAPIAIYPSVWPQGRLSMLSDIVKLMLAVASASVVFGTMDARPDMALMPSG